jgi:hypothetical protein
MATKNPLYTTNLCHDFLPTPFSVKRAVNSAYAPKPGKGKIWNFLSSEDPYPPLFAKRTFL